jgi:hypothetical protein
MTLEQQLVDVFETWLRDVSPEVDALEVIYNPFSDEKIKLPGLFLKPSMEEEVIENSTIFEISLVIEFRYLVERTTSAQAMAVWEEIHNAIFGGSFEALADTLTEVSPDNFLVHYIKLGETQPASRDGERHYTATLQIGCATP